MKKRILVTGGLGFIASHFLDFSVKNFPNIDFINIDALTYAGNPENIDKATLHSPNYFFEKGNICDVNFLEKIFKKFSPTDIIHFAAETHVDTSILNPNIFEKTNILGTLNLLNFHKNFSPKGRFCYISTDEVYGDSGVENTIFTENSPLLPSSPYSASKAAAEHFVHAYARTFSLDSVIIRPSNNFGPRQFREKFIPASIFRLLSGNPIFLYGSGLQKRDWLFVGDSVRYISEIFHYADSGEIYNISGGNLISNIEMAEKILQFFGQKSDKIRFIEDRKGHDFCYHISSEKFFKKFDIKPKFSFDEALFLTFDFYKKLYENN